MFSKEYYQLLQSIVWDSLIIDPDDKKHPLYSTWRGILHRCYVYDNEGFVYYGYKEITMSIEWRRFKTFIDDMGEKPRKNYSVYRIDPDGNYCKENCRWVDRKTQARETRERNYTSTVIDDPWPRRRLTEEEKTKAIERYRLMQECLKKHKLTDPMYTPEGSYKEHRMATTKQDYTWALLKQNKARSPAQDEQPNRSERSKEDAAKQAKKRLIKEAYQRLLRRKERG